MARANLRQGGAFSADSVDELRQSIAMRAGRLVAEEGLDYGSAKKKAVRDILGAVRARGDWLPGNDEIEAEVRAWQSLFQADTQPARLLELRQGALALMERLARFNPYLCGAVLNGTAGEHSDIHLQLFCDSAKDVEIFLLNAGLDFTVGQAADAYAPGRSAAEETIHLLWRARPQDVPAGVQLTIYGTDALRGAFSGERRSERADAVQLRGLITLAEHIS